MDSVTNYAVNFSIVQKNILFYFPLPYVLLDVHGKIRWYNRQFENIFDNAKLLNKNIQTLLPALDVIQLPKEKEYFMKEIQIKEQYYLVRSKFIDLKESHEEENVENLDQFFTDQSHMFAIYFFNITDQKKLQKQNKDQKTITGLIFIDNYEEVMQSIEEVRRPLLVAVIDRRLNQLAAELEGVLRKFERDKYLIIFPHKSLDHLKETKFEILDTIREINMGNELPVTLSIGVGVEGETLTKSSEYARAAIDLALGRGGDQAVIKNKDKYLFYGGKTKGVATSTKVKARIKAYAFKELMEEAERIIIMGHKNPDLDSLGAAVGVYKAAKILNKKAHIVLNQVPSSIRSLYEQIVEQEDYDETMFLDNIEAIGYTDNTTLLVVVDVNRPSYVECRELLELCKDVVVFDHHRTSAEFIENPVLNYIEPYASSTCEMITEIIQYMSDKVKLKPIEADALYSGIIVDTKNFADKVGVRTFEAAAFLKRQGADSIRVRKLFKNDMDSFKAKATAVRDAKIYFDHIAISECPADVDNPSVVGAQAANELLDISGIRASFVMTPVENRVLISGRSLGEMNVQLIMEALGGGGHLTVAGAQLDNESIQSAREKLLHAITQYLEEGEQ